MSFLYLGFCHYILPFSAVKNGKTLLPRIIVAVCSANNIAITISLGRQESTVLRYRDSRTQHAGAQIPFRSSVTLGKLRNFPVPSLSYPQNGDNSVCLELLEKKRQLLLLLGRQCCFLLLGQNLRILLSSKSKTWYNLSIHI